MKTTRTITMMVMAMMLVGASAYAARIHDVVMAGDVAGARRVLAEDKDLVNSWDDVQKRNPLHIAAQKDDLVMARLLLDAGADPDAVGVKVGQYSYEGIGVTPLHIAAGKGALDMAALLIANSADLNARTVPDWVRMRGEEQDDHEAIKEIANCARAHHKTPLHFAAIRGQTEMALMLVNHGGHIDARDFYENTPAALAAYYGRLDTLNALVAKGANPGVVSKEGWTLLHLAVAGGHADVVDLLLARGADANRLASGAVEVWNWRMTPLHLAAIRGDAELVRALAKAGADPKVRATKGATPRDLSERFGHNQTTQLLLKVEATR